MVEKAEQLLERIDLLSCTNTEIDDEMESLQRKYEEIALVKRNLETELSEAKGVCFLCHNTGFNQGFY